MNQSRLAQRIGSTQSRVAVLHQQVGEASSPHHAPHELIEAAFMEIEIAMEKLETAEAELRRQNGERAAAPGALELECRRDEAALRESEAQTRAILETALDCIITIDHEGRILEWNPAAEKTFGYRRAEALGKELGTLIVPPSLREAHRLGLARYLAAGEGPVLDRRIELTAMRADGTQFPVELAITRIPSGGPPMFTGFVREITERKQLEEELRQQAERLVKADRAKDHFLAMLAHELRNPLGAISNALHLLKWRGGEDPRFSRPLEIIERQVLHQSHMLDDLLNVSRIARGKTTLNPIPLDLVRLIHDVAEDHRSALEEAGLNLTLELPDEPAWSQGDPTRLAQVLGNLLQNATKFTDRGGRVTVRAAVEPTSHRAAVTVEDTGIGMEPELLPRVFESFTQAERTLNRSRGGLGLGLALVKGLVELHGGEVRAESEGPGRGARLTFWLPLSGDSALPQPPSLAHAVPPGPLRILVVEDNSDAAESLRDLLETVDYTVALAGTGPAGVAAARKFRPDVVLCDIGLPGMDGYELAAALRRDPTTAAARLIAVSGYGQEEDRRRSHEAGFDWHLTKPIDFDELLRLLEGVQGRTA